MGHFSELVVLAVKGTAAPDALRAAGMANVAGKPVIDATNPIADLPPVNGVLKFFTSLDESLMERLQREFADARLVKAFNSVGNSLMVNPQFAGGKPTMFISGNDEVAKKIVSDILDQFGWVAVIFCETSNPTKRVIDGLRRCESPGDTARIAALSPDQAPTAIIGCPHHQLRRSPVAQPTPQGVQTTEALIAAG
jgi:hypothetical protein